MTASILEIVRSEKKCHSENGAHVFSVIFQVDDDLGAEHNLIMPSESDLIIGEGKNIEEAFASVRAQIELSSCELPWKMVSIKYQSI